MFKQTAFDIWRDEQNTPRIITLCSELDKQLGGGIERGKVTEICGGPNTGKTQLCLQLCLTAQIPIHGCDGGFNGKAIFIDTNQDFSPYRLQELASHISHRFQKFVQKSSIAANKYNTESLLKNVTYLSCKDSKQLLANLVLLEKALNEESPIQLIVIDSFANIIRNIEDGVAERTRMLYTVLTELQELANAYDVAVVVTNELTAHFNNTSKQWSIRPALGHIHAHKINERIILSNLGENGIKQATIAKSVVAGKRNAIIQIRRCGVRSLPQNKVSIEK